jgi:hypothetical protein
MVLMVQHFHYNYRNHSNSKNGELLLVYSNVCGLMVVPYMIKRWEFFFRTGSRRQICTLGFIDCGDGYDIVVDFNPANGGYQRGSVIAQRGCEHWRSATAAASLHYRSSVASAHYLRICCAEPLRSSARSPWKGSS